MTEQTEHDTRDARPSVALYTITRSDLHAETVQGIVASLVGDEPAAVSWHAVIHGPYLDQARNLACHHFLTETRADWLLFVDSDIAFQPSDVTTLVEDVVSPHVTPVIGGVYANLGENNEIRPCVYKDGRVNIGTDDDQRWVDKPVQVSWSELDDNDPGDPVVGVGGVGTGFLAIHRSLLLTLFHLHGPPQPFFAQPIIDGIWHGEDLGFCARVRALGYPVLVHRGVRLAHHKPLRLRATAEPPTTPPPSVVFGMDLPEESQ